MDPKLLNRVRGLRKDETNAEHLLWQVLRNRNLEGWKFRRQHAISGYILDFYCAEAHLGIELDGGHHNEDNMIQYDQKRTAVLESQGIRILRFWNHEVVHDLEAVVMAIINEIRGLGNEG